MELFMIRKDGLFSTGGRYASWEKKGKTWKSERDAQSAIDYYNRDQEEAVKHEKEYVAKEITRLERMFARKFKGKPPREKKCNEIYDRPTINRELRRLRRRLKEKTSRPFYDGCEIVKITELCT